MPHSAVHGSDTRCQAVADGTTATFAPARALYHSAGFLPCGPFAGYGPSKDNIFMTLQLESVHV